MIKRLTLITIIILVVGWLLTPPKPPNFRNSVPRPPNESVEKLIQLTNFKHDKTVVLPHNMMCPQWAQIAIDVGWREEDLPMLDYIIHRESRCFTTSYSITDPNGGSYGLAQVNGYWCEPSKYWPKGYLQSFGVIKTCKQLLHPRANLVSARLIWLYAHRHSGNGWAPWGK